ncbi:MAG TPA: hypothetical protein PKE20_02545, partial [Promineifilum sp.]|nr:hypothetical protein [Promineifilum sp.]
MKASNPRPSRTSAVTIAAGVTTYHFWNRWDELVAHAARVRDRHLPRWSADADATLHNALIE